MENENVRKLINSCDGVYRLSHATCTPEVEIMEVDKDHPDARYMGDVIRDLYALRTYTQDEQSILQKHPIKPKFAWWSSGELMNSDEVTFHTLRKQHLAKKLQNLNSMIQEIEEGTYKIGG